ncbi:MAG TPA: type V CRISPR-associated endonuclease Cas1 [Clostridiaceae bacterium]|nr:type V CRISPR-associated endonuclease Cas1 [Clostridiaceae bacterium]
MLSAPDFQYKKLIFVFLNRGEKVSFSNDNLVVKDKDGKIKHQSTCFRLFAVFLIGNGTLTTGIIQRARRFGFSIVLMTGGLRVYEVLANRADGNTLLREKQYKYEGLELAKYLVSEKIDSQISTIKKARQSGNLPKEICTRLEKYRTSLPNLKSLKSILGTEGVASKEYFQQIFCELDWKGRQPRVKANTINSLLDRGYTLLFCFIEALLNCYGFDLYKGVYHQQFYMRKSLVCDLVEPFRPLIDYQVRRMYRLGQVDEDDFYIRNKSYLLQYKHVARYTGMLMKPLIEYKDDLFLFIQQFYRSFMRNKEICEYPHFSLQ